MKNSTSKYLQCNLLLTIDFMCFTYYKCYESMLKGLSKEATLVLSNTRELDKVPSTE